MASSSILASESVLLLGYEFVEDHSAIKPLRKEYAREEE